MTFLTAPHIIILMKDIVLGFLSPTGDFIKSDEGTHGDTAHDLLLSLGEPESKINNLYFYPTEYLIYYYNYVLIHMPEIIFRAVHVEHHIVNEVQKIFLEKYETENGVDLILNRISKKDCHEEYWLK